VLRFEIENYIIYSSLIATDVRAVCRVNLSGRDKNNKLDKRRVTFAFGYRVLWHFSSLSIFTCSFDAARVHADNTGTRRAESKVLPLIPGVCS
jgi:hypothetical protein